MKGRAFSEDLRTEIELVIDTMLEEGATSCEFLGYSIKYIFTEYQSYYTIEEEDIQLDTISETIRYIIDKFVKNICAKKIHDKVSEVFGESDY